MAATPPRPGAPHLHGELGDLLRALATAAATITVFAADLAMPRGVAGAALYLVPLVMEARFGRRRGIWLVAAFATILLTVDTPASADVGSPLWIVVANRGIAFGLILTTASLLSANLRAAERLRGSERRVEALLESAAEAIFILDEDGRIRMANAAAVRMFGYARDDLLDRSIDMLVPAAVRGRHAELRRHYLEEAVPRTMAADRTAEAQCRDGSRIPVEISLSTIRDQGQRVVMAMVADIRPRVEAEARLRRYAERLEASNRELEQFAFVASHDLQEPLRKIQAFSERVERGWGSALPDEARDYVRRMREAATRMRTLIDDLLDYSRVRSRAQPFDAVDLTACAEAAAQDLELRLRETGAAITIEPLPSVRGDADQLRQLFVNLLSNAMKFVGPGTAPRVLVSGERRDDRIVVRVRDNGIGIDPERREQIFAIFQRLHGRGEFPGTGIGLAIARRIVERHHGTIGVEDSGGDGTTMRIELPDRPAGPDLP